MPGSIEPAGEPLTTPSNPSLNPSPPVDKELYADPAVGHGTRPGWELIKHLLREGGVRARLKVPQMLHLPVGGGRDHIGIVLKARDAQ